MYKNYLNVIASTLEKPNSDWTFKSHPVYNDVLEHVSKSDGDRYLSIIANQFPFFFNANKEFLINLCHTNDAYGLPNKMNFDRFTSCSPTNLRYILHSLLILTYMKECNLNSVDVIEIGGGYGGLCFYIHKLAGFFSISINTYTIFDLDLPLKLQRNYLDLLGISGVRFQTFNTINDLRANSFLISNYAFSEISLDLQEEYITKVINPYASHGFLAWNFIPVYPFVKNKYISNEVEYPIISSSNYFVRFRPLNWVQ